LPNIFKSSDAILDHEYRWAEESTNGANTVKTNVAVADENIFNQNVELTIDGTVYNLVTMYTYDGSAFEVTTTFGDCEMTWNIINSSGSDTKWH